MLRSFAVRRGGPGAARLHAGQRPDRGRWRRASGGRRAASAAASSRSRTSSSAPPRPRGARNGHRRVARPFARPIRSDGYRLQVGLVGARGDAAALHRGGAERPRVSRADAVPRRARRARAAAGPPSRARPARPLVPAQAALAVRVPAAPRELRRVRRRGRPRRVPPAAGGARVRRLRPRRDRAHTGGPRAA